MLTWIRRILLGVSLLVLAVSAAILLFEPSLNLTSYRGFIARELRQNTGREIQVGGDVHLKLGRYVQIVVHDIRMTNPSWCQAKQQFKVSEAAVGLDLLALFSGIIHLRDLELHDVVAVYEVSTSDEPGCDLKPEAPVASARRQESHPFRLVLENVLFEQASLIVRNPRDNRSLELWLESFKQQNHDGMLVLEANGRVNDLEMRLAGSVGTLDALLHGRHIKVDLQGNLDQIDMTLRGRLGDPRRLEGIELVSTLQGQGFDRLLKTFGVPYQHDGNIDMRLRVMDLQPGFAWSSEGYLGALNIHTQGKLERPLEWDGLQATVDIQGEDLSLLGRFLAVPELPRQAYQLTGQVTRDTDGLVLRDIKLESGEAMIQVSGQFPLFPNLQQAAAQLNVNLPKSSRFTALLGRELGIPGPLRIEASLTPADNGDATVDARLHLSDNQASLQGRLGEYPHYHHTRLDFSLAGPNFGVLAAAGGLNGLPQQAYRLAGEVQIDPDDRLLLQLSQGRLGKLQFVAQGSLGRLPELESADLQVTARGDSLRAIAAGWSEAELPDQPFQLETRLRGKLSAPRIGKLSASLGAARLQVAGSIGLPPDLAGTDAKFEFDVPDMVQLLPASRRARWPGGRYRAIGKIQKSTQALELRDVEVSGQQLKLTLSAAIPDPFRFVDTKLRLKATTPDLAAVMPALPPYHPPKVPASLDAQLQSSRSQLEITSFRVESAETRIEGEGHIALAEQPVEISLVLQATGPRLSDLGVVDGFVLPAESFALSAELRQFGKRLDITDLNARVGQGKFTGKVRVEQRKRPYVEMQARVNRLNMGQFLPPSKPTKGAETDKSASAQSTEARLIPDVEPDLRFLDALDGHFQLRMGELGFPDPVFAGKVLVAELELDARLDSGNLTLDKLWSTGERGEISLSGRLTRKGRMASTDWQLQARDFRVGLLAAGEGLDELPAQNIDLELSSQGRTYRDHAAALNGNLYLSGGSGRTPVNAYDKVLNSFLKELLTDINPFIKKDKYNQVECSAAAMDIQAGVIRLHPGFVSRTDKIDIALTGSIDLKTEKIDAQFKNAPRKGIGLSAAGLVRPFIKVGGTLMKPNIELDPGKALLSGTAAVATSGLTLIAGSVLDRLSTATNPCEKIIAEAKSKGHLQPLKQQPAE